MTIDSHTKLSIADALGRLMKGGLPFRFEAYDGSVGGPEDSPITVRLVNERGLSYLMTAPGDLGFARAYVAGDLQVDGVHPGNPYEAMALILSQLRFKVPSAAEMLQVLRSLGLEHLKPPPPPAEEHLPKWRRALEGLRHHKNRDATAIQHHYDVSNRFYELVLGPSMTYTCALFPAAEATLEEAQYAKYDLICRKLDLKPGDRLLDLGCGWGGMVRHAAKHYGVKALGVTLSREQADWAQKAIVDEGLADLAEVRHSDYRDLTETGFDAISSIGLTEHIGVRNYPDYFRFAYDHLRDGGRMLNHCITRPDNVSRATAGAFIDRYVFPDGELTGVGRITVAMQDAGLEVRHAENLREHYALTLKGWCENLEANWDEALKEVTLGRAKVWGLYMAGSRLAFERNEIELHHVLGVKAGPDGNAHYPLRVDF
ncbi:methyltransferase domain-containing protein [Aeromicrobium phragmitis]|uniref:Methyltransferase domain-containing protein n=1 Tax=Aeromicrobium phragmitis TaxID=2478914 RepID=A0A3L8PLW3_9ACTN|nr:class I SAM-dependent methyltransferase [Aeromicrobium phragmitis]RLV55002.1 methyltransferase domain-containing protein [Aeromicrobium phragmitis]